MNAVAAFPNPFQAKTLISGAWETCVIVAIATESREGMPPDAFFLCVFPRGGAYFAPADDVSFEDDLLGFSPS
jgi:hypothetical protein